MAISWLDTFSRCNSNSFHPLHRTTCIPQRNSIFSRIRLYVRYQASMETNGDAVVVGAGPAGCLMTHYLLNRGFRVQVFERYPKMEQTFSTDNPDRQSKHLKVLVWSSHLPLVRYLRGAVRIYQMERRTGENLSIHFGFELIELNSDVRVAYFSKPKQEASKLEVQFDLLVGADGMSSKVRSEIMRLEKLQNMDSPMTMEFKQFPASYKTFYISPTNARVSSLFEDQGRVQSWPPLNMLLVNVADGSFWGGTRNEKLINSRSPTEVEMLFRDHAPEVFELLLKENANFVDDFIKQPSRPFAGAVKLSKFHKDHIILIGDAAHAMETVAFLQFL